MKYVGLVISDIHVGAFDLSTLYQQYTDIFIHHIRKMNKLDFIIIDGDFFDHKFYLNDKPSTMAYKMLVDLFDVCASHNSKIRIVYGTESHECNQYDVLSILNAYDDVRIIKKCEEEDLFEDLHVLYIPEEQIYDKSEYYKEYLTKKDYYNYVFGHGIIREVMSAAAIKIENRKSSKSKQLSVPVFSSGELEYCCKGQVFFGHYHINKMINEHVMYVGSFSRWCFGEEEDKGFYQLTCNTDMNKYKAEFIVNIQAETYVTVGYGYDHEIFHDLEKMDKTLTKVDKMLKQNVFDHIKFEFNIPDTIENPESSINYLRDRYKFDDNVKVEIVHGYIEKRKEEKKKEVEKENEQMAFIDDKNISIEEKLHRFVIIKNNRDIKLEHIVIYMTQSIPEMIESLKEEN